MEIHVPTRVVALAIPSLTILAIVLKNRYWIWHNKGSIALTVSVLSSIAVIGWSGCQSFADSDNSNNVLPIVQENWRDKYLPGKWKQLYEEMTRCTFFETKMLAFEEFCAKEASKQPLLPAKGFDEFCFLVRCKQEQQTYDQIQRLSRAAKTYLTTVPD